MNQRNHDHILQECLRFLEINDVQVSGDIRQIVTRFFSTDEHLSIEQIEQSIDKGGSSVSRQLIEKTMQILIDYGFATRKTFDNRIVYEHLHLNEHHDHLYCIRCGKILEFFAPEIEKLQLEEAAKKGFHAFNHKLQIYGFCAECFGEQARRVIPLAMVEPGGRFRIENIVSRRQTGLMQGRRLMDMGILPGVQGEVISNTSGMSVIHINGTRIALGRGQSQRVMVNLIG
ncbi:MAG: transcriptional repressor [Chitinivibrionales bacterium]